MSSYDEQEELRNRLELKALADSVPTEMYQRWSYQMTVDFKAAVTKARKLLKNPRAKASDIRMQLAELRRFHGK